MGDVALEQIHALRERITALQGAVERWPRRAHCKQPSAPIWPRIMLTGA